MDRTCLIKGAVALIVGATVLVLAWPYDRTSTWVPLRSQVRVGGDCEEFHVRIRESGPYYLLVRIPLSLAPGLRALPGTVGPGGSTASLAGSVYYAVQSSTGGFEGTATALSLAYWARGEVALKVVRFAAGATPDLRVTVRPDLIQGVPVGANIGISVEYGTSKREGWRLWAELAECAAILILCWGGFLLRRAFRPV